MPARWGRLPCPLVRAAVTASRPLFAWVLWEVRVGSQKVSSVSNVTCDGEEEEDKTRNSGRATGKGLHCQAPQGWVIHALKTRASKEEGTGGSHLPGATSSSF